MGCGVRCVGLCAPVWILVSCVILSRLLNLFEIWFSSFVKLNDHNNNTLHKIKLQCGEISQLPSTVHLRCVRNGSHQQKQQEYYA